MTGTIRKMWLGMVAFGLGLTPMHLLAADQVAITMTKKTAQQSKGTQQEVPRGTTRAVEKEIVYVVELRSMIPHAADLTAEWVILVEMAGGRVAPGNSGSKSISLNFGQTLSFETGPVTLLSREWNTMRAGGTVKDDVAGYGIRVVDSGGAVLAEKYEPLSIKSQIDWTLISGKKALDFIGRQPIRTRPMGPLGR